MFSVWSGCRKLNYKAAVNSGVVEAAVEENIENKRVQPFLGADNRPAVVRRECSCSEGEVKEKTWLEEGHAWTKEGVKPEQEMSDIASWCTDFMTMQATSSPNKLHHTHAK